MKRLVMPWEALRGSGQGGTPLFLRMYGNNWTYGRMPPMYGNSWT